jgi:PAS domain S-box-containing protein
MSSPSSPASALGAGQQPAVLADSPFAWLRLDDTGAIAAASATWEQLSGRPVEESLGRAWTDYLEQADVARWQGIARRLLGGQVALADGTVRLLRPDGTRRTVELRGAPLATPGAIAIILLDSGGRPPAAPGAGRGLRLTDESTQAIVERAAFGIFRCTREGTLLDVNPAMATILGYPDAESTIGVNLFDELKPGADDRERCLADLAVGSAEVHCDLRGRRRDGAAVHLRLAVTSEMAEGDVLFLQGMAEDITERARREEIVRRGERMASLARTLAGVAHEINNPLAAITGFAQILLKRDQSPDDRHAHETILHEARRAAEIIKQLLTIARRQEGSERVRVDINAIVRYLVDTQRYAMDTRGIAVALQLSGEAPRVLADPAQLEQVVLNLLVNARQALETRLERRLPDDPWSPALSLATWVSNGRVSLAVTDNGPGIPPSDLPHIWDPFWTTREEGEGSGLGLSVVHSIVGAHGGTIEATSTMGTETSFVVTFPLAAPAAPSAPPRRPARDGGPGATFRLLDILVVDDEAVIRELLSRYFTTRGHAVMAAMNGEQALRLAEQGSFDVVISDLRMPGMDGRSLIRRLRTLPTCAKTRFILSTGDTTATPTRPGDDDTGDVAVVTKPYDVDALVDLVEGA